MRISLVALAVAALVLAVADAQAIDVPGLGLDHPALEDTFYSGYATVKGGNNPPSGIDSVSQHRGRLKGGVLQGPQSLRYGFPATANGTTTEGGAVLSSTLVPIFAVGTVVHAASTTPYSAVGPFLQATIYEPDQIKRKGGKKPRVQIKQKSYLAFRFGQFQGSGLGNLKSVTGGLIVPDCKGQADFRTTPQKTPNMFTRSAKMKVKCSGNSAQVEAIKELLSTIFGKSRNGFDLAGSNTIYKIP